MMDQVTSGTIYPAIFSSNNLHCLIKYGERGNMVRLGLTYEMQSQSVEEWFYVNTNVAEDYPFHHAWFEQIEAKGGRVPHEIRTSFDKVYSLALEHNVPFLALLMQSVQDAKRIIEQENSPQPPQE